MFIHEINCRQHFKYLVTSVTQESTHSQANKCFPEQPFLIKDFTELLTSLQKGGRRPSHSPDPRRICRIRDSQGPTDFCTMSVTQKGKGALKYQRQNHLTAKAGGHLWKLSSPNPCSEQDHLVQVAQASGEWRLHDLSRQSVPVLNHPYSKGDFS